MWKGKLLFISKHAFEGMYSENPPIIVENIEYVINNPDYEDGNKYRAWVGNRTIIVYVSDCEDYWEINGVSATKRKLNRDEKIGK